MVPAPGFDCCSGFLSSSTLEVYVAILYSTLPANESTTVHATTPEENLTLIHHIYLDFSDFNCNFRRVQSQCLDIPAMRIAPKKTGSDIGPLRSVDLEAYSWSRKSENEREDQIEIEKYDLDQGPDFYDTEQYSSTPRNRAGSFTDPEQRAQAAEDLFISDRSQAREYLETTDELPKFWNPWDRKFSIHKSAGVERPLTLGDAFRREEYLRQLSEQLCPSTTETHDDSFESTRRGKRRVDYTKRRWEQDEHQLWEGAGTLNYRPLRIPYQVSRIPNGMNHGNHRREVVAYLKEAEYQKMMESNISSRTSLDLDGLHGGSMSTLSQSIESLSHISEGEAQVRQRKPQAITSAGEHPGASFLAEELRDIGQLDRHAPFPMSSGTPSIISGTSDQARRRFSSYLPRIQQPLYGYKACSTFTTYDRPVPHRHIRLIRFIENPVPALKMGFIELFEVPLDKAPPYEALSYRWSSGKPPSRINCNGKLLAITSNLQEALRRLNVVDRLLWVDSICINQDDVVEKGEQVALMSEIYSKAVRVLVWLGENQDSDSMYLSYMELARAGYTSKVKIPIWSAL